MSRAQENRLLAFASMVAIAFLFAMTYSGSAPTHANRVESKIDGVLQFAPAEITSIGISWTGQDFELSRRDQSWSRREGAGELSHIRLGAVNKALDLLYRAPPVRILRPEETATVPPSAYGLAPASLSLRLRAGPAHEQRIHFGARANDGIVQFARIEGAAEVYLFSGFVGDAWRALVDPAFVPGISGNAE